ncbi:MarR family transcriptional regulator [Atopobiaceae bacterium 24-176]
MEGVGESLGACGTPTQEPVPDGIRGLAEDFITEMCSIRRLAKPPVGQIDGHDLRLEDAGRGCMGLLRVLSEEGGHASPSLVARRLDLTPARVSNILAALERGGLVERGPSDGDRRRVEIRLTDRGHAIDRHMKEMFVDRTARLLAAIGEKDTQELVRIMGRIVSVLEAAADNDGKGEQ